VLGVLSLLETVTDSFALLAFSLPRVWCNPHCS